MRAVRPPSKIVSLKFECFVHKDAEENVKQSVGDESPQTARFAVLRRVFYFLALRPELFSGLSVANEKRPQPWSAGVSVIRAPSLFLCLLVFGSQIPARDGGAAGTVGRPLTPSPEHGRRVRRDGRPGLAEAAAGSSWRSAGSPLAGICRRV